MTHPPVTDESGLSQLAQLQNRFWACYVEGFHILSGTRSLCCIISIHIHEHSGFLKYRKSVVPLISWQLDSPKLCTIYYVFWACYVEGFHILSGTRFLCCIISIHIHEHSGFLKYRKSVVPLISWRLVSSKLCTRWSCYSVSHPVQG